MPSLIATFKKSESPADKQILFAVPVFKVMMKQSLFFYLRRECTSTDFSTKGVETKNK